MKPYSSKKMVGINGKQKSIKLKNEISRLHSCQKFSIRELKTDMKKIDNAIISTLNLSKTSASEIERIQDERKNASMHMVNVVSNLVVLSRKLSHLENRYRAQ